MSVGRSTPEVQTRVERLRRVAKALDWKFRVPGTRWRFGLDPLLGLVPGVGDSLGAVLSLWIVVEARRLGVPNTTAARMLANVGVDFVAGSVPLLGDLFDAGFKANMKNVDLLERAMGKRPRGSGASRDQHSHVR